MNKICIDSVFSIGFRCNTDDFLADYLNIRKYSSPFSHMVIDIKMALNFISTNFKNYIDKEYILPGNNTYKFNNQNWICNHIHKFSEIKDDKDKCDKDKCVDILLDTNNVCIWNHHDLNDENIINSFKRRSSHLLKCLKESPKSTLLVYIERIQKQNYFDKKFFDELDKYNCNFLILIPLFKFNLEPFVFYSNKNVKIIYFNSNYEGYATEKYCLTEDWNKIKSLVNNLYTFDIKDRDN